MKLTLNRPKLGKDYNICGKDGICDYCKESHIGKCGMIQLKHRAGFQDIAVSTDDKKQAEN